MPQRPNQLPLGLLVGEEVVEPPADGLAGGRRLAELAQHGKAAGGDVGGGRVEQRAVIGEGDVVEVVGGVVDVEGAPAAVGALHAEHPFPRPRDRPVVASRAGLAARAVHRHHDHGRVVEIDIVRVLVLERPATRPQVGTLVGPVALDLQFLQRLQPVERLLDRPRLVGRGLHQGVRGQHRVPDGRQAGLAERLLAIVRHELFQRRLGRDHVRMVFGHAEHVEHHHGVGDGGIDRPQPVLAVEPLAHEGDGLVDRRQPALLREQRARRGAAPCRARRRPHPRPPSGWRSSASAAPRAGARRTARRWTGCAGFSRGASAPSGRAAGSACRAPSTRSCRCGKGTSPARA